MLLLLQRRVKGVSSSVIIWQPSNYVHRPVIALDTSPTRLALARHNAQIYGVADRIEFILTDYISFVRSQMSLPSYSDPESAHHQEHRTFDVVFLSPPWGGPSYLSGLTDNSSALTGNGNVVSPSNAAEHPSYSLSSIQPIHGTELFDLTRKITKNIAYYLPRNTRLGEISELLSQEKTRSHSRSLNEKNTPVESAPVVEEKVEVEEEWTGNKLKALTCYFGGLASGQEGMF